MCCGLLRPDGGAIDIAGLRSPRGRSKPGPRRLRPDDPFLYDLLSAREFFDFVGSLYGVAPAVARSGPRP